MAAADQRTVEESGGGEAKAVRASSVGENTTETSLAQFASAAASNPKAVPPIPSELEHVLEEMAKTGVPYYSWAGLKELLSAKLAEVVGALEKETGFQAGGDGKQFKQRREELESSLRRFDAAPFTLQRLAEILREPRRQYACTHKLMNGLERLLSVSSTLPQREKTAEDQPASTSVLPSAMEVE
ncbi:unnamed protein product, partial [Discosporangium mesarthrocarpum]